MTDIVPNEEFIKRNYDKTIDLIRKVFNTGSESTFLPPLLRMIEDLGERYALCPASSHKDYYSAFPGGLCYHNLHVLTWIGRVANTMAPKEFSNESLLVVSLLHSVGKVGDEKNDLYIPTKEDWKIQRGAYYDINPDLQYVRYPQRSLYLASRYNIPLTQDEYLAIMLAEGQNDEANSSYKYREPKLALILQYASQWAERLEKENNILWPT